MVLDLVGFVKFFPKVDIHCIKKSNNLESIIAMISKEQSSVNLIEIRWNSLAFSEAMMQRNILVITIAILGKRWCPLMIYSEGTVWCPLLP